MLPMHELEKHAKTLIKPWKITTIILLGFGDYTFVDLAEVVYMIFHKERLDLC